MPLAERITHGGKQIIGSDDDETDLTAAQLREVVQQLAGAGRWRPGDPPVLVVMEPRL